MPTDAFDIQLVDQNGSDLLQGLGINSSGLQPATDLLVYTSTNLHPVVDESDTLTLIVTGNVNANAQIGIDVYYALGY